MRVKRLTQGTLLAGILLLAASVWGQGTITAQITGGNGSGKCTFEVRVDGVADVQIRGNQGYLQTKAGMPAQWVRLKCNQPLPRNPNNFRFAGVDGRGKQYMVKKSRAEQWGRSDPHRRHQERLRGLYRRHLLERRQQ